MTKKILNLGVLAHVDTGKTTLTENLLYYCGAIRKKGSVDKGSTLSDSMKIERQRGISIRASSTSFIFGETRFNLIDTPGHIDFSAEVERCLRVLDAGALMVSAIEGVQAHTLTLWNAMKALNIPVIIFINKADREGADSEKVIRQIQKELNADVFPLNALSGEGSAHLGSIDLFSSTELNDEQVKRKELALESLAGMDEDFLEDYLNGKHFQKNELFALLAHHVSKCEICPILVGSAKYDLGTAELLAAMEQLFYPNSDKKESPAGGLVYKVDHDPVFGRLAHVRMFSGELLPRKNILNHNSGIEMKATRIARSMGGILVDQTELKAGDVGIVSGWSNIRAGDIVGDASRVPLAVELQEPILTVSLHAVDKSATSRLAEALNTLSAEDPTLHYIWYKSENEMQLSLMGPLQIEILKQILKTRFDLETVFSSPEIIYKESPATTAEGFIEYTMPKPCWAVMNFRIEPGEPGSGVEFISNVSVDKIQKKYQNEISACIPRSLAQGIRGWEVIDLKITLTDGEDHEIHSRPGDFALATPMGIMQALKNSGTQLLEPMFWFEIHAAEKFLGSIVSDLTRMRARFNSPVFNGDQFDISGEVPAAESMKYSIRLSSLTGGMAKLKIRFSGYQPCPEGKGIDRPFKGVNPLNQSQWILQGRGAFKADER